MLKWSWERKCRDLQERITYLETLLHQKNICLTSDDDEEDDDDSPTQIHSSQPEAKTPTVTRGTQTLSRPPSSSERDIFEALLSNAIVYHQRQKKSLRPRKDILTQKETWYLNLINTQTHVHDWWSWINYHLRHKQQQQQTHARGYLSEASDSAFKSMIRRPSKPVYALSSKHHPTHVL